MPLCVRSRQLEPVGGPPVRQTFLATPRNAGIAADDRRNSQRFFPVLASRRPQFQPPGFGPLGQAGACRPPDRPSAERFSRATECFTRAKRRHARDEAVCASKGLLRKGKVLARVRASEDNICPLRPLRALRRALSRQMSIGRAIRTALTPTPTPTSAPDGKPPSTAISAEEAEWRAGKAQFEAEKTERTPRR
jgi:hypothetical protein